MPSSIREGGNTAGRVGVQENLAYSPTRDAPLGPQQMNPDGDISSQAISWSKATGSADDGGNQAVSGAIATDNRDQRMESSETERKKEQFRRRKMKERRIKKLMTLEEIFEDQPKYPIYYVVKIPGIDIESELNVIAADNDIKKQIGQPRKISKMSKNALLIEVANETQSKTIIKIEKIDKNPVIVETHKALNQVKGTVYSEAMGKSTEEEILERLKDQGAIKEGRMKKKVDRQLVNTHRYIIFNIVRLPTLIKLADWHREAVEMYIPTPLRCINCQRLGHTKYWCRRTEETCARCGESGHRDRDCNNNPCCVNCKGEHSASSRDCERYKLKAEILATQAREHTTYYEAEESVGERYIEQGKTFSSIAKRNTLNQYGSQQKQSTININHMRTREARPVSTIIMEAPRLDNRHQPAQQSEMAVELSETEETKTDNNINNNSKSDTTISSNKHIQRKEKTARKSPDKTVKGKLAITNKDAHKTKSAAVEDKVDRTIDKPEISSNNDHEEKSSTCDTTPKCCDTRLVD